MKKTIAPALLLLFLSSFCWASDYLDVPDSQFENYSKAAAAALVANDYNCTDELNQSAEADSSIPYQVALKVLAQAQTIKARTETNVQLYFSTSESDEPNSGAIRVWIDSLANDHKTVASFSVWAQEETNIGDLENPQMGVRSLGKYNCEAR
jgi:hypothetical protein